jgi:hypothetical protein
MIRTLSFIKEGTSSPFGGAFRLHVGAGAQGTQKGTSSSFPVVFGDVRSVVVALAGC